MQGVGVITLYKKLNCRMQLNQHKTVKTVVIGALKWSQKSSALTLMQSLYQRPKIVSLHFQLWPIYRL